MRSRFGGSGVRTPTKKRCYLPARGGFEPKEVKGAGASEAGRFSRVVCRLERGGAGESRKEARWESKATTGGTPAIGGVRE